MSLWRWVQGWRHDRMIRRLVHLSADVMLSAADEEFRESLTDKEKQILVRRYNDWLCGDESRLLGLINQPTRTVQMFLSDVVR
jgi:hypothetical protein